MNQHLDLDALADVLAHEVPEHPPTGHLQECASCQSRLAELRAALPQVTASLAELPDATLPEEVASRLAGSLAAEVLPEPAPAPPAAPAESLSSRPATATVTPIAEARRERARWLPIAGGVAAASVAVLGGLVFLQGDRPGSSDSQRATAGTGPTLLTSSTGTDYTRTGTRTGSSLQEGLPTLLGAPARDQAGKSVPSAQTLSPSQAEGAGAVDPLAELRDPTRLASCLAALSDPSDPGVPLALDYARFEGAPAMVVVLPTTRDTKVDVFVVGAGCTQADADVLFFTRLDKP